MRAAAVALLAIIALCDGCQAGEVAYGEKVKFAKGQVLKFPDCQMEFLGKRKVAVDVYPRGFIYSDFRVTAGGESKTLSWSSGTGEIAPLFFEIAGKKFVLELSATRVAKGFMKDDELVLWRRADYDKLAGQ